MKIKLIFNPKKPWAKKLAKDIASFLEKKGRRIVRNGADATVCIGGDGTVLYNNHMRRLQGPVIGIGTKNSYICQLNRSSWRKPLLKLLEKGKKVIIMTLMARVGRKNFNALNDFVIHVKDYRVMEMDVRVAGKRNSFYGDGIIISSALGSAAYAYSAGGARLRPTERKISIVPICPYRRAFSPVVLAEKGRASVRVNSDCAFIIDGVFVRHLKKGERVHVERGKEVEFFEGVGSYKKG
jgi:NAD+ kinase